MGGWVVGVFEAKKEDTLKTWQDLGLSYHVFWELKGLDLAWVISMADVFVDVCVFLWVCAFLSSLLTESQVLLGFPPPPPKKKYCVWSPSPPKLSPLWRRRIKSITPRTKE
jgi:hypothetical protein